MKRKYYIDNIRSLTILLVIIYHAFYLFNGVGIPTVIRRKYVKIGSSCEDFRDYFA